MIAQISAHDTYMQQALDELSGLTAAKRRKRAFELLDYHQKVLYNTQHERLIHLLVTFFFALLLAVAIAALWGIMTTTLLTIMPYSLPGLLLIAGLLVVTEAFYIKHYYELENGVQRLYRYTTALGQVIQPTTSSTDSDPVR